MTSSVNMTNFEYAETIMPKYIGTLEKQRDSKLKQTASKVLTVALFTLGMLAFLTSSIVGLPAWMIVGALVGWTVSVLVSGIWNSRVVAKQKAIDDAVEICKVFEKVKEQEKPSEYRECFKIKLDNLSCNLNSDYPKEGIEKKIINYCEKAANLYNSEKNYNEYVSKVENKMNAIFEPEKKV